MRIDDDLCNKEAIFQYMEVQVVNNSDGETTDRQVSQDFYIGVLTGLKGEWDGSPCWNFIRGKQSLWTFAPPTLTGDAESIYAPRAQSALSELLKVNKQVLEDILLASEFIRRLEAKDVDCSQYRAEVKALYARLQDRQSDIQAYSEGRVIESPQPISDALDGIINDRASLGLAVSTSVIVTAVVVGSFSALAWYVFYTDAGEGRSDCRKSAELNKILSKVDSSTREDLYEFIDKYADSFYKRAVARTKWNNLMGNVKTIAIVGALGFLAYKFLYKGRNDI